MQAIHRNLMGTKFAGGANLPSEHEVRKTAVMPTSQSKRSVAAWQVYLDNYASWSVTPRHPWTKADKDLAEWHRAARECWARWNIPSAQDKSLSQCCTAKELGCYTDRDRGSLGTTINRRLSAILVSLFII